MISDLDANKQIQRILSSHALQGSEVHRNLLQYLAEKSLAGQGPQLKEYTVGLEVFGKPASYDPRQESIVRVHVGRLRQRLADYYRTEGVADAVVVELPKGGFLLTFAPRLEASAVAASRTARWRAVLPAVAVISVLLMATLATAGYIGMRPSKIEAREGGLGIEPLTAAQQEMWSPLLSSSRPLMVTFSSGSSPGANRGTANAAFLLGQFLGQRRRNVFPVPDDELSIGEIMMADVIAIGAAVGHGPTPAPAMVDTAFVLTADGVKNVTPAAGEPAFLPDSRGAGGTGAVQADQTHALISVLPGPNNGAIVYFEGNQIASLTGAVQAMTDPDLASELARGLKRADGHIPRFYQLVLSITAVDDTPMDIAYVCHRALSVRLR